MAELTSEQVTVGSLRHSPLDTVACSPDALSVDGPLTWAEQEWVQRRRGDRSVLVGAGTGIRSQRGFSSSP